MTPEELQRRRAVLNGVYPTPDAVYEAWDAAWHIVDHFLGREWTTKNLNPEKGNQLFMMRAGEENTTAGHLRQHRLVQLAKRLHDLQQVPGHSGMVAGAKSRSLSGVFAELEAVEKLRRCGYPVRFVTPVGVKGADYDAEAEVRGQTVFVEVKAKDEHIDDVFKSKSMLRSLEDARAQLPPNGPGLVFVYVPSDWASNPQASEQMGHAVSSWLRKTARVNAVALMYDQRVPGSSGEMLFLVTHRLIPNPRPRTVMRNVLALFEPVGGGPR